MREIVLVVLLLISICICSYSQQDEVIKTTTLHEEIYKEAKVAFTSYEQKHGKFIQTNNVNLHYLVWGDPKHTPLIWIHGSFTNSYELKHIVNELLENEYYVIAIDYYGHGQTKIPKHEVSLYHVADDINELMQAKKIEKAIIGGWSRGGIIATAFYDSYPEKVWGLILEDGGSVSTNTHYHKMGKDQLINRVNQIFEEPFNIPKFDSELEAFHFLYDEEEGGIQVELLAWPAQDSTGKWTIGEGIRALFHMSSEEQFLETILRPTKAGLFGESMSMIEPKIVYRNLNVPMLILDPISDQGIFPYEKENKALKAQHSALITHVIFNNTGHNIHYEQPERFTKELIKFKDVVIKYWSK